MDVKNSSQIPDISLNKQRTLKGPQDMGKKIFLVETQ